MRASSAQAGTRGATVRFETLDSWRGICALLVAMMHFPAIGPISESLVVRNAFLFVDYFFVLSGFVIAHGYGRKLNDGMDYLRFTIVRFGRIYPLHLAILLVFVAFELLRLTVPALRGDGPAPFTSGNGIAELVSNLLLLNGVGFETRLTWNGPSWSISAEFWTYLLFGGAAVLFGRRHWIALIPVIIAGPLILYLFSPRLMDATWDYGFIRCLYGFALGALLYHVAGPGLLHKRSATAPQSGTLSWTLAELGAIVLAVLFVALAGRQATGIAAPFVFALTLLVFAHERGIISRLLKTGAFLWPGALSYGIYMVHVFVQARMIYVATLAERLLDIDLVGPFSMHGEVHYGFGVNGALFGTAMLAVMVGLVVIAALIGYFLVEKPFQRLSKRLAASLAVESATAKRSVAEARARGNG
ncbi:acyltransferase family protein [Nitratireductor soli]|uniref:acyltransferase family protein n=1 Tax=Nitratireductor soli TaxID=1670619 RepID=UPI0009E5F3DE|nr:acyltransferase [Nitratireductor soli]